MYRDHSTEPDRPPVVGRADDLSNIVEDDENGDDNSNDENPLLARSDTVGTINEEVLSQTKLSPSLARKLYVSHCLSTWNARTYEFAVVVFTVEAFPDTLAPASINGILQCMTALVFSPSIGRWSDRTPSRLLALRTTIIVQRMAMLAACAFWFALLFDVAVFTNKIWLKYIIMAMIIVLNSVERLAAGGNMVVMERDWVSTIASPTSNPPLHKLNAVMRRIDLLCKVVGPAFVSILPTIFTRIAWFSARPMAYVVTIIGLMSILTPLVEWKAAQRVYDTCDALQVLKDVSVQDVVSAPRHHNGMKMEFVTKLSSLNDFVKSDVFLPTISLSLLYTSVLSFGAAMTTFLLNAGFSLPAVTAGRVLSSILEVSATIIMPVGVKIIRDWKSGTSQDSYELANRDVEEDEFQTSTRLEKAEVERVGLWGLWWMVIILFPAVLSITKLPIPSSFTSSTSLDLTTSNSSTFIDDFLPHPYLSIPLLLSVSFSRIGLWTYDLAYSQLQQTLTPSTLLGSYTGIEQSFIATAELVQWLLTGIWSRPERFGGLAWSSWAAVLVGAACYAEWVRRRRGHLVHWEKAGECCKR